jgi:basic membrane protein A
MVNRVKSTTPVIVLVILCLVGCGEESDPRLDVKVISTTNAGIGDLSFVDEVFKGLNLAALQCDFYTEVLEPESVEEASEKLDEWLTERQRLDRVLIITIGFEYVTMIEDRTCLYNERKILHLDQNLTDCQDLKSVTFRTYASSFLAGVAAMEVSTRKTAAALGGMNLPPVNEYMDGFEAGVEYAGGTITYTGYIADDPSGFNDPDEAKRLAKQIYADADVIIPVAGGSSIGVIDAAKQMLEEDDEIRYAIGIDTDQSFLGIQVVIGSSTKNLSKVTSSTVLDYAHDEFTSGPANLGMDQDGSDFVPNQFFADQYEEAVENARADAVAAEDAYYADQ